MGPYNHVLVTGGGGQVARALARTAAGAVVLDRASLDITDRTSVHRAFELHRPQVVINAAAYTNVDGAEADPAAASRVNAQGPMILSSAAEEYGARLVQISTDHVFSGDKRGPYVEDHETGPSSVYGRTKLEGEKAVSRDRNLIIRTSWVFGHGRNFVNSIIRAARANAVLTVVDDQWGLPTYAEDLAEAILKLMEVETGRGVYHLAGGGPAANRAEVAEVAIEAAGLQCQVQRVSTDVYNAAKGQPTALRPVNGELDCSKAASLGVTLRPWRQALVAYVAENRNQKA